MSVSYSTGVRAKRVRPPKMLTQAQQAERTRLLQTPHFMRVGKDYPEEFHIPMGKTPARVHRVEVQKGHSPHTGEKYTYMVTIYLEDSDAAMPRFAPASIHRVDQRPKKWVNHLGSGLLDLPEGGLHYVWSVEKKARSERLNSIISKAKTKLAKDIRDGHAPPW